jgi:hypothetical protein
MHHISLKIKLTSPPPPPMPDIYSILTLIFSAIAAIAASISLYHHFTSKPKLKVLLNDKEKELIVIAGKTYLGALRIINLRNTIELFQVIIEFPSSFKLFNKDSLVYHDIVNRLPYEYYDIHTPQQVIEPGRIAIEASGIIIGSKIIFRRMGVLPWNLSGKDHFDFLFGFTIPTEHKNYDIQIIVSTSTQTFIKNFNMKVINDDKSL